MYSVVASRRGISRRLWSALALVVLVASLIAVPGATPAFAAEDIEYTFIFADGGTGTLPGRGADSVESVDPDRTITGTATSNDFDVVVDGEPMEIKMNCDDLFHLYDDKFGGPVLPRDDSGANDDWG